MNAGEEKAIADIEAYGCHVIHVFEDEEGPPFSYSVGIQKTSGAPEVIVVGLKEPIAHFVLNEYNRRIRKGERFVAGAHYDGFLESHTIQFANVEREHFVGYLGWDRWLYGGNNFDCLQIIYPTTSGIWPWDNGASDWFRKQQPVLNGKL